MTKEEFSQNIIRLIDGLGYKQKTIAERTGFSSTAISRAYNRKYDDFAVRADMPPKLFKAFPELKEEKGGIEKGFLNEEIAFLKEQLKKEIELKTKLYEDKKITEEAYRKLVEDHTKLTNEFFHLLKTIQKDEKD